MNTTNENESVQDENVQQNGQQNGEQQGDGGNAKIAKKYDSAVSKLTAMLRGNKTVFKKTKVAKDDLATFVEELLKERKEEAMKNFKGQAIALIDKKVAFDRFVTEKQKAFEDEITKKKKEFTDEANKVFGLLENIDQMEIDYKASLTTL